jgi:glycosyltransferase involved in cell wall biosynthesis
MDIAIIPAYNPDLTLIRLVEDLRRRDIGGVIVVNDGSEEHIHFIFDQLLGKATVLTHEVNHGKGAAIRTALKYIQDHRSDIEGIVILDADGQHRPEDAMNLLTQIHDNDADMVLGVRKFSGKIPFRSRFGNTITRYVFRLCSGMWVSDTQTGLRAFRRSMIPKLLAVKGDRYEYEMNVLLTCAKNKTRIKEVPIATVYHDATNSCSHFRAVRDSARIYGNILAFSGASFVSFLLDYALFFPLVGLGSLLMSASAALAFGNVSARVVSAAFNYYLNTTFIFQNKQKTYKSLISYVILACFILTMNTIILYCIHDYLGVNKAIAKLITELLLFIISFTVQKFVIFNSIKKEKAVTL